MATVRIHGYDKLKRQFEKAGGSLLAELGPSVTGTALALGMVAQATVPRGSGELAASYFVADAQEREDKKTTTATVGYDAKHAAFAHEGLHYGRKLELAPKWLEHAADQFRGAFKKAIREGVQKALRKVSGGSSR